MNNKEAGIKGKRVSECVYPKDILSDLAISMTTLLGRGFWYECLFHMWANDTDNITGTEKQLTSILRCSIQELRECVDELKHNKVCEVTKDNGIVTLVCRRLHRRILQRKGGAKRQAVYREKCKSYGDVPDKNGSLPIPSPSSFPIPTALKLNHKKIARGLSETEKKRKRVNENSPLMVRIGDWFGQRPTTRWSLYTAEALKDIDKIPEEELLDMQFYYEANIDEKKDFRRRNIETLLNNWTSELDRAVEFCRVNRREQRHGKGKSI